jgi:hypothetical protein
VKEDIYVAFWSLVFLIVFAWLAKMLTGKTLITIA